MVQLLHISGELAPAPWYLGTRSRLPAIRSQASRQRLHPYLCHQETGSRLATQPWGRRDTPCNQLHAHPHLTHQPAVAYKGPGTAADTGPAFMQPPAHLEEHHTSSSSKG